MNFAWLHFERKSKLLWRINLPPCGNYPENKRLLNIHLIHFVLKTICIRQKQSTLLQKILFKFTHFHSFQSATIFALAQTFISFISRAVYSLSNEGINLHAFELQLKIKCVNFLAIRIKLKIYWFHEKHDWI